MPKLAVLGVGTSEPAARPVPASAMATGELEASETMLIAPVSAPALAGVKVAEKETLWLGAMVAGRVRPVIAKPGPLGVALEMVTDDPPVLVKEIG